MTHTRSLDGVMVVFDLDGTLIDTAPDLAGAMNFALQKEGLGSVPTEKVQGQIGVGSRAMIVTALNTLGVSRTDAEIDAIREVLLARYQEFTAEFSAPYPGVIDALDRLEADGARFAICTNKPQALADTLLHALDLHSRFDAIIGSDSVPEKKPHPDHLFTTIAKANGSPERAVMIGDSNPDERAAANAGLPFILVPFGYGPIEECRPGRVELAHYNQLTSDFLIDMLDQAAD